MRCPRCLLADIPEGMGVCVRCGYVQPAPHGAPGFDPAAAVPTAPAASASEGRRPEWFATPRRVGPAPPVVIMDDGDEDRDEDEDREWAPRPARRIWPGVAAAVGLTIALGSGAAWLNSGSAPAPPATQDIVGPATAPPTVLAHTPPDTARSRAAPLAPVAPASLPHPDPRPVARPITPRRGERSAEAALVSINAIPWGSVYVDGRVVGNTPQLNLPLAPGSHQLRVVRAGFQPYQRVIAVAPGQRLRITDITLAERH